MKNSCQEMLPSFSSQNGDWYCSLTMPVKQRILPALKVRSWAVEVIEQVHRENMYLKKQATGTSASVGTTHPNELA